MIRWSNIAKELGLNRALDRLAGKLGYMKPRRRLPTERGFNAASVNRLTADWTTQEQTIDTILKEELPVLRARSRDLAINNAYGQKFLSMVKAGVLGHQGMMLKNKALRQAGPRPILDEQDNKTIEDNWKRWGRRENCTISKDKSWIEVQALILEAIATDGECFIRKYTPFDNEFNFAIQVISAEMCDHQKNGRGAGGNVIRLGVELNEFGQRQAYWFHKDSPSDNGFALNRTDIEPVSAARIIHPYVCRMVGQTRGYPWLTIAGDSLNMLGGYEEAELVAARTGAGKMGFIIQNPDVKYTGEDDDSGNKLMEVQPGAFERLNPGEDVKSFDPAHPSSAFGDFVKASVRRIAAGLNMNYNTLASDMEGANFSSLRHGLDDMREFFKLTQRWYADRVCQEVFSDWLEVGLLSQAIPLPFSKIDKFDAATWHGRRWTWVDPSKEVTAKEKEIELGLTSVPRIHADMGVDTDEIIAEQAEYLEKRKAAGLDGAGEPVEVAVEENV